MRGPVYCWYKFEPLPSQRVELHLYRVLGLGAYSSQQDRCEGGGLQFVSGDQPVFQTRELEVCGDNVRFSPPIVMFRPGPAFLLVASDGPTARSQFLAHYSFTSIQGGDTGVVELGGKSREGTPCDWDFYEMV